MRATFIGLLGSFVLLFAVAVFAGEKPKNVYKLFHLSATEIGVTCQNGADPTGRKVGELVIISCDK
jgi:hypothetical protein